MTPRGDKALARQLQRYYVRFNEDFWAFFEGEVRPALPENPVLADLGCGPGLYLQNVSARVPGVTLIGVDKGEDMLRYARSLEFQGSVPTFENGDVAGTLPLADESVDLLTIAALMHTLEDPFRFLEEVRRVLAPGGLLLLYDWVRVGFREYIDYRVSEPGDPVEARYSRALELFSTHNKYTAVDWRWIFDEAKFEVVKEAWPHSRAIALLTRPA